MANLGVALVVEENGRKVNSRSDRISGEKCSTVARFWYGKDGEVGLNRFSG
jgi:hypothetical protein